MAGDCKTNLPAESTDAQQAQAAHDGTGQEDAGGAGEGAFFEVHIKQAGGKSAGPGAGARQGYPYEQQQRPVQSAAGFGLELTPGFLPFFQAKSEEFSYISLISPPYKHFSCKK